MKLTTGRATTGGATNSNPFGTMRTLWTEHREASLNWLALGLLLAAWNATSDDAPSGVERCPPELRGYEAVSVRAALRTGVLAHSGCCVMRNAL